MPPFELTAPERRDDASSRLLGEALSRAFTLVHRAEAAGFALALDELGDIDLPPTQGSVTDSAHLHAIAPLYFACELESTQLIACAESLAALAIGGGLPVDLGSAAHALAEFWRARNQRASTTERQALFARLFGGDRETQPSDVHGGAPNAEFENIFIDLCEALYKLDEGAIDGATGGPYQQTRVRMAAARLAENLLRHSNGAIAYLARDALGTLQSALAALKQPDLQHAFGTQSLWDLVRVVAERYLHAAHTVTEHVARGKSGMLVLSWLADALAAVNSPPNSVVAMNDPVIAAATEWLQASLSLSETPTAATAEA